MSRTIVLLFAIVLSAPALGDVADKCAEYSRIIAARYLEVLLSDGLDYSQHRSRMMALTIDMDEGLTTAWVAMNTAREKAGLGDTSRADPSDPAFNNLWTAYIGVYGALLEWHQAMHARNCDSAKLE